VFPAEQEGDAPLLRSEVQLPAGKTSVLGFEDSAGKPYFLALQRPSGSGSVRGVDVPRDQPIFILDGEVMRRLSGLLADVRKDGRVVLQMTTGEDGKVSEIFAIENMPKVGGVIIDFLKELRFIPRKVNDRPIATTSYLTFIIKGKEISLTSNNQPTLTGADDSSRRLQELRGLLKKRLGNDFVAPPFDFDFNDCDLAEAVRFISHATGVPIRIDEGIERLISCDLKQVPWDRALSRFLESSELEIKEDGQYLRIFSPVPAIAPARGYISSTYGWRRNPRTGEKEFHRGIDIATQIGAPVTASADGTVSVCEFRPASGQTVVIDHGSGYQSLYANLARNELRVKAGDPVRAGQTIGFVGQSNPRSTGPHLHYEVLFEGQPVNPFDFIRSWPKRGD
jgi:murein DD-endopeptidase MepM/ murein hydrolase activator NlpD